MTFNPPIAVRVKRGAIVRRFEGVSELDYGRDKGLTLTAWDNGGSLSRILRNVEPNDWEIVVERPNRKR